MKGFWKCCIVLLPALCAALPLSVAAVKEDGNPSLIQSISLQNGSMPAFDRRVETYTAVLDSGETVPEFTLTTVDDAVITGISGADVSVEQGQTAEVIVSAYLGGQSDSYTIYVSTAGAGNGLSFLQCTNGTMSPLFRESTDAYYIILPNDQTEAKLDVRTLEQTDEVIVFGADDLQPGKQTKAHIDVISLSGQVHRTDLLIFRQPEVESSVNDAFLLSSLVINGGEVPLDFSQKCGYYELTVEKQISQLSISAIPANRKNVAVVSGSTVAADEGTTLIHVLVFDPAAPDEGRSIYTLAVCMDTFDSTPRFTSLQFLSCVLSAGAAGLVLGSFSVNRRIQKDGER